MISNQDYSFYFSGICNETSNTTFQCLCSFGYTGKHCQTMIDYCEGITCQNNGICRSIYLNYSCICLGESYSGRHCEISASKTVLFQTVSRSVSYIVIIFLVGTAAYIIIMDILKYFFVIDLAKPVRQKKMKCKSKHQPVIQRFVYVVDTSHTYETTV